jgi:hypothetical protein
MPAELPIDDIPSVAPASAEPDINPIGTAVTADEVSARLSPNLYKQLSDGSDGNTLEAVRQAEIYTGSIFRRLGVTYNLDDKTQREIVLLMTVYELHMRLGHEEAGREYRLKAKDIILARYGSYPDTGDTGAAAAPAASVAVGRPHSRYTDALHIGDRFGRR